MASDSSWLCRRRRSQCSCSPRRRGCAWAPHNSRKPPCQPSPAISSPKTATPRPQTSPTGIGDGIADREHAGNKDSDRERDRHDKKERKQHDKRAKKEAKKAKKARRRAEQGSSASEDEPPAVGAGGAAPGLEPPWLAPHIAVKIIDKHVKGGRCGPLSSVRQPA